jgi:predicted nucleotidyltransferase
MQKTSNDLDYYVETLRELFPVLSERFRVAKLSIFGSIARGQQSETSDLDLLVCFQTTPSLLDLIYLEDFFICSLDRKVDMTIENELNKDFIEQILNDLVDIH